MALPPIQLSSSHLGVFKAGDIVPGALEECNGLLEKNHEAYHIFFRDPAFHNHMVHSLLTCLTLGAPPDVLQDRYNDLVPIQRKIPEIDTVLLEKLSDPDVLHASIGQIHQYHTFLAFFKREMASKGWKEVVQEYLFSRTKLADRMLAQILEGAYHPIIHLGFGIEFDQPAIVAEGLAQAASHDRMNIETLFFKAERLASDSGLSPSLKPKPLVQLAHEARTNDKLRTAPRWSDLGNKMKDGVVGRALDEMAHLAAQFRIPLTEKDLDRRTAEMVSTCAYLAGSVHVAGRQRKIDFFVMHSVTSSIFCTVVARQGWIALADRVRLVEWKARLDLAWYVATGCGPLDDNGISGYASPENEDMEWEELFYQVVRESDDGHAAKFIRALKNGEETGKAYENGEWGDFFPMKGDMWLKLARMCQDTTKGLPWEIKWVFFAGFEEGWKRPDLADPLGRSKGPVNGF
ncbi:uncharacterized protein BCR38DRAFT_419681 [Pseudomassariella vexata]|uniref:Oxidoreductase AflY n=1 Tax=Pseudomassariella vexata TaxID=1141098 RepID=A0A1Y2EDJ4_9PEZI|nr:uncharacterized protein BCR38DRAFT_419681 [Pseudomassariella vexata]ORY69641.1 hypothetical protein BCR38DRAFT_419681 [Pseudomassariella vexata]